MNIKIYKDTNFGNNESVWNVPAPSYNFSQHEMVNFDNYVNRFPVLTNVIMLQGEHTSNFFGFDYLICNTGTENLYYFINSILAERNVLIFSVTLDILTTFKILEKPVTGIVTRKHHIGEEATPFEYPLALNFDGASYTEEFQDFVNYSYENVTRFIESGIDLTQVYNAVTITDDSGEEKITFPRLPVPKHKTQYTLRAWGNVEYTDENNAFTLYLLDSLNSNTLNSVRGLAGDGAISDSFILPNEAFNMNANGSEVVELSSTYKSMTTNVKMENEIEGYTPRNKAVLGMFSIKIMSQTEKTQVIFPSFYLNVPENLTNGNLNVGLWADVKPSGTPYCRPLHFKNLHPIQGDENINLSTLEHTSVRGSQWLKAPFIFTTGSGEAFATVNTELQRQKAEYDRQVAVTQHEHDLARQQLGYLSQDIGGVVGLFQGRISQGVIETAAGQFGGVVGGKVQSAIHSVSTITQTRELEREIMANKLELIGKSYTMNMKNLNAQENARRVTPPQIIHQKNESLGSYSRANGFTVSRIQPNIEFLIAKDIEFSKYGYPTYEVVENFVIASNLRNTHTCYQIKSPIIELGGTVGDYARTVLEQGIRVLSDKYTISNLVG